MLCIGGLHVHATDFTSIVDNILANNPELHVQCLKTDADIKSIASENNFTDPQLDFSHQWGQNGVGNKWSVGVSQSFEWPGVYAIRARRMDADSEALRRFDDVKIVEMRLKITEALVNLIYQKKLVALNRRMVNRIDSMLTISNRGLELGDVSILDVNILRLERIEASRKLSEAITGLTDALATVNTLNGGCDCTKMIEDLADFPATPLHPLESYIESAAINNPVVRYNNALDRAETLRIKTIRRSFLPGFSIGYSHDYELGDHFNGLNIGLTLPIFSNRKKLPEVEARRLTLQAESDASRLQTESQITKDYKIILQLDNEIREYGKILDDNDNMRLLLKALNAGQISIIDYFDRAAYFLDAHAGYLELQRQRALAIERLSIWNNPAIAAAQ